MIERRTGTYVSCKYKIECSVMLRALPGACGVVIPGMIHCSDYHTTVIYSRKSIPRAESLCKGFRGNAFGDLKFKALRYEIFDPRGLESAGDDTGALVLILDAPELVQFHHQLLMMGGTSDYENYVPHITLSYSVPRDLDLESIPLPSFPMITSRAESEPLNLNWIDYGKE